MFYFFLLLCIYFIAYFLYFKIHIKTATMAVIMAFGIFIHGVILNFFHSAIPNFLFAKILMVITLALWISFYFSIWMTVFNKKFKSLHFDNLMNRFAIGTWVAASSICGIIINKDLEQWKYIAVIVSILNLSLWIVYIGISLYTLFALYKNNHMHRIHGVIFLTTVSTQSIVLLLNSFNTKMPQWLNILFISLGLCLYIISLFFVLKRYTKDHWKIETDWNNTNCILHGALSITGLACIITQSVTQEMIMTLWVSAFTFFLIVESIEVHRLIKRVKTYGFKQGCLIYDVTQWSRVFTFAMFYTFTFFLKTNISVINLIKETIFVSGIWFILLLVIFELYLNIRFVLENKKQLENYQKDFTPFY